jgi:hypothetical protein
MVESAWPKDTVRLSGAAAPGLVSAGNRKTMSGGLELAARAGESISDPSNLELSAPTLLKLVLIFVLRSLPMSELELRAHGSPARG